MLIIHQYTTGPHPCPYLAGQTAEFQYSVAPFLSADEYEELMDGRCRKFGLALFRPVCKACAMCRPIRFAAAEFAPDRSQRRALRRNADLEVRVGAPSCDAQRLELYRRYHRVQRELKAWPQQADGQAEYEFSFVHNQLPSTELSVWEKGVLRGVLITENTPNVVSAVYHYYEPECSERGLGTFLIMQCARLAECLQRRWVYLGYYIAGCRSMEYKAKFQPCEVLGVDGVWKRHDEEAWRAGISKCATDLAQCGAHPLTPRASTPVGPLPEGEGNCVARVSNRTV
ncbi:MAG TPA: arginyltransferase [Planctomycetota bacterium]|nr:arginyltransferase [Planctomycetota bacterium]